MAQWTDLGVSQGAYAVSVHSLARNQLWAGGKMQNLTLILKDLE